MRAVLLAIVVALLPLAGALPAPCTPSCTVEASGLGYAAPVTIVPSGSTVTWTSSDTTHTETEGPLAGPERCLDVYSQPGGPASARFDIVDGQLFATTGDATLPCGGAVGDGAGGFALAYFCALHPTMRGTLVVVAS